MAKLGTPFQLFLFLSLFFFNVPPTVPSGPVHSLPIYRNIQRYKSQMAQYRDLIGPAKSRHSLRSMRPPGPPWFTLDSMDMFNVEAQANGEYYVVIGVGTPPIQVQAVLDTGSDVTWIQCQPCVDCYSQIRPIFNPANSGSYESLAWDSRQCLELWADPGSDIARQTCEYIFQYADGSSTIGDYGTETLSFDSQTKIPNIAIGCGHNNTDSFGDSFGDASGVFGLGRGSLSFISQAQYSAFSYCLAHTDSPHTSLLEFGSSAEFSDADFTTPMLRSSELPSFYFVGLTGVSVNDQVFPIPSFIHETGDGGAIVDCGTVVTRFPQEVYNKIRDAFVKAAATGLAAVGSHGPFDTCFALTSQIEANFPIVAFHFGKSLLTLPRENVMFSVENNYTCFGFAPADGSNSLIGSHQQQGIRVSFDEDRSTIGLLPGNC